MKNEIIAFDIGGTNTRCALVINNKIKKFVSSKTPKDKERFLQQIYSYIDNYKSEKTKGIGIAFPGLIENGIIRNAPNLSLKHFDIKRDLEKKFKLPVEVFNDAGCVSLAEAILGCKKKNFFVMTLGTGIGGGIVANGEIYRGLGRGAEFGHMYVKNKDFESLWKETKRKISKEYGEGFLIKDIVKKKDKKAHDILFEAADYLGQGIASIMTILDPEVVILAGGLKESGPTFLKMIQKKVDEYSFLGRKVKISWSKLKEPGVLGAGLLVK